ncbi:MAG TPA: hypothetical protein VGR06_27400 [Actinophytocola sp.]|uniref:hypothetical protein n=1 Tax=Actinophytocola sp. TaxID=1872138 RepID=UPI002E0C9232|nr:hypothetical protein [Actinophytocola sp.]
MPPSRRHSRTPTPPTRRPRVAGLRHPGAGSTRPAGSGAYPEDLETTELDEAVADPGQPETIEEPAPEPPPWRERDDAMDTVVSEPVIGSSENELVTWEGPADEPDIVDSEIVDEQPGTTRLRPAGKRRALGLRRPDDLGEAEADLAEAAEREQAPRPRRDATLTWAVALAVVALLLGGLAVWFQGEATRRTEGADTNNRALADPATQSEVVRQLRTAIEKSLSYNYTDLDSTARAVQDNLSGKALCEYDQLFGEVKKLAPEQKIVLSTQVREIGVTRLEADQAQLLVFVDQRTTRADQNQTTASGAQFNIRAQHQGDKWKITEFDMLGQPLPNGKPAPQC